MTVQVSKSGGIYIEISGDYSQLQKDLQEVRRLGSMSATEISNAFKGAVSPADAARIGTSLTKAFKTAENAAQGLKADLSSFEQHFRNMGRAAGIAEKDLQKFAATQVRALEKKNADKLTRSLQDIQKQAGLTNAEMEKLAKSMGAGSHFKPINVQSSVSGFSKMAISSAAAYLSVSSLIGVARELTDSMLQMSRLNISYQSIFGGSVGATQQLDHVYAQTQAVGLQFQETAGAAKTFFAASQGTSLQKDINSIFDAISSSAAALQMSTDDVNGVFLALGQMVSKGKVQAEELRGQLGERLPGAFQLAAKAMNMSTAELDKFMADGKLTADDLLPKLAQALKDKYAKAAEEAANSVQGSINRMSTEWEIFKANVVNSDFMVGTLNLVTSALKSMNAETTALREDIAIMQRMSAAGIQKRFVIDDDGESGSFSYTSVQKDVFRAGEIIQNSFKTAAESIAREQEAILAKSRKTTSDFLKNTKEAKLAALEEERSAALKNNKELESVYQAQGANIDSVLKDRLRIEEEYQRRKKEIEEKGTGGAKGLANKQFKFDTGLEQLRQEVANMEATINPAAVGIEKLRQKLELEKQNAIAAAEAHAKLSIQRKEASSAEAGERQALEIRKAELTYTQKIADAVEKGRQVRVDFYKDFAAMSGNYVDSINAQIEAIRRQAEEYRNAGISDEMVKQWEAIKQLESARDPMSGTILSLQQWTDEASNQAKNYGEAWRSAADTGVKALTDLAMGAEVSAQDIAKSFARMFIEIQAKAIMAGVTGGLGSLFSGMFGGGADTSAAGTDLLKSNTVAFASANGNVFSAPALSAYSNSIVSKPTIFPFAKGVGLMGEAGAEAIMPLRRGSGGRLGVDASGLGAQQQAPQVNVIVNTPPGVGVAEQEQKSNGQGGFDLTILLEMVDKAMASGISSGRSKTAHAMNMRGR